MNKTIHELAEQAGLAEFFVWTSDQGTILDYSHRRFVELIARECLNILDDEDDGEIDTRSVRLAAIRIKKLFGVAE